MNKVWIILLLSSICALIFINPSQVLLGLTDASNKAVKLSFELCAIYAVWMGVFSILEQTGITKLITKLLSPIIDLIYGKNNLSKESKQYVTMNMSANLLGMNGAATPLGIKAIESMNKDNINKSVITGSMIMLVVVNCSSIQILPTTIMGMMSMAGSQNPSAIVLPSLLTGLLSTIVAIILVKIFNAISKKIRKNK